MHYEYRCVAGPAQATIRRPEDRDQAVIAYEDIINREARDGWDYVGTDEFQIAEPSGCLGLGKLRIGTCKMLVFRRPAELGAMQRRDAAAADRREHRYDPRHEPPRHEPPRRESRADPHLGLRPEPAPERVAPDREGPDGDADPREPRLR